VRKFGGAHAAALYSWISPPSRPCAGRARTRAARPVGCEAWAGVARARGCGEAGGGVVVDVDTEDALELATVDDQDPVEALAPDRPDVALGVGVRLRRPDRRLDDCDPLAAEDLVERAVELGVAIANHESKRRGSLGERPSELARLLRCPGAVRLLGAAGQLHASTAELDEEQDVQPRRADGVDGEEVAGDQARRLSTHEPAPGERSAFARRARTDCSYELADGRRRDSESESRHLTGDPLVARGWVLAREAQHELTYLARNGRAAHASVRARPTPRDQLAVPAHERVRRHEQRAPATSRQNTTGSGEEGAVRGSQPGPSRLAPQDLQLMTEHHDLELLNSRERKRSTTNASTRRSAR
jgi:hypothetical protein